MRNSDNPRPEFMIETSVGTFVLSSYKDNAIYVRFGQRQALDGMSADTDLPEMIVNRIGVRGNLTMKRGERHHIDKDQWYYDGGTIERSDKFMTRAPDGAWAKVQKAFMEEVPGLITDEMKAAWNRYFAVGTLHAARALVAKLEGDLEEAKQALVQAAQEATLAEHEAAKFEKADA